MSDQITYKDVNVPKQLLGVIDHMADVERYREELHDLGNQWDLLTILGQISGTGTDMTETRTGFQRLTSELLGQLGLETLKKTVQEIGSKAQVAVDIVIRNLFERTADIGFLATDDDIREFLKFKAESAFESMEMGDEEADPAGAVGRNDEERVAGIVSRFQEYVAKYSVYFNIILLDTAGSVLAQLDEDNDVQRTEDPLVAEALTTKAEYVEIFRHSDLLPSRESSLIYAYRVTEANEPDSGVLGVLCLCFRFENEMEGVFENLRDKDDWSVITLLDRDGCVIASSEKNQIPIGSVLETALDAGFRVTRFAGREYLAKTCATKGYQGFMGLGWYGHVMIPIEHAFDKGGSDGLHHLVDQNILAAVMNDPRLFSDDLRSIPIQADHIQRELERTVWNGNVRENNAQSKVLLWNISDAGARTKKVFEESIGNLHETVVGGILNDVEFQAALAVDIMDRNLYERANDCRWWALTSAFRIILAQPKISDSDRDAIAAILSYINGLYTVYTNLFVYDARGRILAVSNPAESEIVGKSLTDGWVRETLSLRDSQDYSVSPFESTSLYGDRHTYIYGAAITEPGEGGSRVGGIGIVFDSEPQFREMLRDSLPRNDDGEVAGGCFGIFTDRQGRIISATDERFKTGDPLEIDRGFFAPPRGEGASGIVPFQGVYYAVGSRISGGYREYKVQDGYVNDVAGLVFVPLADVAEKSERAVLKRGAGIRISSSRGAGDKSMEVATFYIGDKWLGVEASKIKEATGSDGITTIPLAYDFIVGKILYQGKLISVLDIRRQLKLPKVDFNPEAPIVVVDAGKTLFGLVVDALGEISEINMDHVESCDSILDAKESYTECIVKPESTSKVKDLLVVLNPEKLVSALLEKKKPALAN